MTPEHEGKFWLLEHYRTARSVSFRSLGEYDKLCVLLAQESRLQRSAARSRAIFVFLYLMAASAVVAAFWGFAADVPLKISMIAGALFGALTAGISALNILRERAVHGVRENQTITLRRTNLSALIAIGLALAVWCVRIFILNN